MNDHDRKNLEFLITASPKVLQDWFDTMIAQGEDDDLCYAMELVRAARNEIEMELLEIFDEESEEDVSDAAAYLKKFQLR